MTDKAILAAYSGLTVTALMVTILGLTVLNKCHKDRNYGPTFLMSLAITMTWAAEFVLRGWWTIWKNGYISRDPVSWMMNHEVVFVSICVMMASGLLFIKALTDEYPSPQGRMWKICFWVSMCVAMMAFLKR